MGTDGTDNNVHNGGGKAYQKTDGRPSVRALLLIGSDNARHHLEGVVEQVPHYKGGDTNAICINYPCVVVQRLRLPGGGNGKPREYGRHKEDIRFISAELSVGILQ